MEPPDIIEIGDRGTYTLSTIPSQYLYILGPFNITKSIVSKNINNSLNEKSDLYALAKTCYLTEFPTDIIEGMQTSLLPSTVDLLGRRGKCNYLMTEGVINKRSANVAYSSQGFECYTEHGGFLVPFDEAYVLVHRKERSQNVRYMLASVAREMLRNMDEDVENELFVDALVDYIGRVINTKFYSWLDELLKESKRLRVTLTPLPLYPEVTIFSNDGESVVIYPAAIPICYSLKKSIFSVTKTITLGHSMRVIRDFFRVIFTDDELPTVGEIDDIDFILNNDVYSQFATMADYLGIDFYVSYFNAIVESEEYAFLSEK